MSNKGRPPNNDERSLWDRFVDGIKPLSPNTKNTVSVTTHKKSSPQKSTSNIPLKHPTLPISPTDNMLDRKTLSKLKKGKMVIEGKIDLHNKNQDQAYHTLKGFVSKSFAAQKRCVLVVTGKGVNTKSDLDIYSSKRDGIGVLKSRLPEWVSIPPLNEMVLRIEPAHRNHGGGGAFYLYLRRHKPN